MIGPDWVMVALVYFLVIAIDAIILGIISPLGWPPVLIGLVGCVLTLFAFSSVACTDPGIVYKSDYTTLNAPTANTESLNNTVDVEDPFAGTDSAKSSNLQLETKSNDSGKATPEPQPTSSTAMIDIPHTIECGQCDFRRPYSARHCTFCQTCVDELDHHCPWCGKCIGDRNIKQFYFFLNVMCFQFYYLIGTLIYYLIFKFGSSGLPTGPGWS